MDDAPNGAAPSPMPYFCCLYLIAQSPSSQVLATKWPAVLAETIPCDVVLRQLQREPGAKGSKAFDLARCHSLPPKKVTLFRSAPNGELVPHKVDLGSTLSEKQQHAISAWREAPFDGPGSPLVLGPGGKEKALRSWAVRSRHDS